MGSILVSMAEFRHVGGGFRGSNVWVSGFAQPREVEEGERWWSAAGDTWVGDWWLPPLTSDVWRMAVMPDAGQ